MPVIGALRTFKRTTFGGYDRADVDQWNASVHYALVRLGTENVRLINENNHLLTENARLSEQLRKAMQK